MEVQSATRDKIIQRAVLDKLSSGPEFFTSDDILAVAGIDDAQLRNISASIMNETKKQQEGKKKQSAKRRTK